MAKKNPKPIEAFCKASISLALIAYLIDLFPIPIVQIANPIVQIGKTIDLFANPIDLFGKAIDLFPKTIDLFVNPIDLFLKTIGNFPKTLGKFMIIPVFYTVGVEVVLSFLGFLPGKRFCKSS